MYGSDKTLYIQGVQAERARLLVLQTLRPMQPGQVLKLVSTERDALGGVFELCRQEGYGLLDSVPEGSRYVFFIRR